MEKICIIGFVAIEPELKEIAGENYVSAKIPIQHTKANESLWYDVLLDISRFRSITKNIKKGTRLYVSGFPKYSAYISKRDGKASVSISIFANDIFLLNQKKDDSNDIKVNAQTNGNRKNVSTISINQNPNGQFDENPFESSIETGLPF